MEYNQAEGPPLGVKDHLKVFLTLQFCGNFKIHFLTILLQRQSDTNACWNFQQTLSSL